MSVGSTSVSAGVISREKEARTARLHQVHALIAMAMDQTDQTMTSSAS